jgi:hypothetical protein
MLWQPGVPGVMGSGGGIAPPGPASYPQPAYQQPTYQQPTYQQPAYQQPTYQQPAYQPGYQQPVPAAPPPAPSAQTVADRLIQLDQLRQHGILSESEFQAKKTELLQQL